VCWGAVTGGDGEGGSDRGGGAAVAPLRVGGNFTTVAVTDDYTCAARMDGSLHCFGGTSTMPHVIAAGMRAVHDKPMGVHTVLQLTAQ